MNTSNIHSMNTRSKNKLNKLNTDFKDDLNTDFKDDFIPDSSSDSSIDENGNLKNLIDDSKINNKNDEKSMKELNSLFTSKKRKKNKNKDPINNLFLSYLIMKATEKANLDLKKNRKNRKKKK